jgi:hypothetical protein
VPSPPANRINSKRTLTNIDRNIYTPEGSEYRHILAWQVVVDEIIKYRNRLSTNLNPNLIYLSSNFAGISSIAITLELKDVSGSDKILQHLAYIADV